MAMNPSGPKVTKGTGEISGSQSSNIQISWDLWMFISLQKYLNILIHSQIIMYIIYIYNYIYIYICFGLKPNHSDLTYLKKRQWQSSSTHLHSTLAPHRGAMASNSWTPILRFSNGSYKSNLGKGPSQWPWVPVGSLPRLGPATPVDRKRSY